MTHTRRLTVLSLISIVLMTLHLTGDVVLGFDRGAASPMAVLILVVWLCGTLVLDETRWGSVIMLLGGLMAAGMPLIHFRGHGVDVAIAASTTGFFFIWILFAVGATGSVTAILAARELWRRRPRGSSATRSG